MAIFRVERTQGYTVMSNHHLKDRTLTLKSKGLLSMMLSLPDEWNYSTRGLAAICKEGVDAIGTALKELEDAGYIVRSQLRDERGRITDTEYVIYEKPQNIPAPEDSGTPPPHTASPYTGFPYMGNPDMEQPDTENPAQSITNRSNTKRTNKNQSIQSAGSKKTSGHSLQDSPSEIDRMDEINSYREYILENIEYSILIQRNDPERVDEVVELILETVCSRRPTIRVAGEDYPQEVVKSRMLKLDASHIEYALECIDKNLSKIHNIKSYLLTTLYNAPATINSYYQAEVNHQLYGNKK